MQRQQCIDRERTANNGRDGDRHEDTSSTRKQDDSEKQRTHFIPTHPRASTRENAVVGVAETVREFGRPRDPLLSKRGVFMLGNARVFTLGVRIIVEGAALGRVLGEGEGGKTNNVWDGVGRGREGAGGLGRVGREGNSAGAEIRGSTWVCVLWGGSDFITPGLIGDEGTVGRIDRGGGRRRPFKVRRALGSGGTSNVA